MEQKKILKKIKPDFSFSDERGSLVQLVREGYKQFNIIFSKKDAIRGDHFHKFNKEAFYVIKGRLRVKVTYEGICEEEEFGEGDMFQIDPYVMHSFFYLQDTWLASMYSIGVELENGKKDIFQE